MIVLKVKTCTVLLDPIDDLNRLFRNILIMSPKVLEIELSGNKLFDKASLAKEMLFDLCMHQKLKFCLSLSCFQVEKS